MHISLGAVTQELKHSFRELQPFAKSEKACEIIQLCFKAPLEVPIHIPDLTKGRVTLEYHDALLRSRWPGLDRRAQQSFRCPPSTPTDYLSSNIPEIRSIQLFGVHDTTI